MEINEANYKRHKSLVKPNYEQIESAIRFLTERVSRDKDDLGDVERLLQGDEVYECYKCVKNLRAVAKSSVPDWKQSHGQDFDLEAEEIAEENRTELGSLQAYRSTEAVKHAWTELQTILAKLFRFLAGRETFCSMWEYSNIYDKITDGRIKLRKEPISFEFFSVFFKRHQELEFTGLDHNTLIRTHMLIDLVKFYLAIFQIIWKTGNLNVSSQEFLAAKGLHSLLELYLNENFRRNNLVLRNIYGLDKDWIRLIMTMFMSATLPGRFSLRKDSEWTRDQDIYQNELKPMLDKIIDVHSNKAESDAVFSMIIEPDWAAEFESEFVILIARASQDLQKLKYNCKPLSLIVNEFMTDSETITSQEAYESLFCHFKFISFCSWKDSVAARLIIGCFDLNFKTLKDFLLKFLDFSVTFISELKSEQIFSDLNEFESGYLTDFINQITENTELWRSYLSAKPKEAADLDERRLFALKYVIYLFHEFLKGNTRFGRMLYEMTGEQDLQTIVCIKRLFELISSKMDENVMVDDDGFIMNVWTELGQIWHRFISDKKNRKFLVPRIFQGLHSHSESRDEEFFTIDSDLTFAVLLTLGSTSRFNPTWFYRADLDVSAKPARLFVNCLRYFVEIVDQLDFAHLENSISDEELKWPSGFVHYGKKFKKFASYLGDLNKRRVYMLHFFVDKIRSMCCESGFYNEFSENQGVSAVKELVAHVDRFDSALVRKLTELERYLDKKESTLAGKTDSPDEVPEDTIVTEPFDSSREVNICDLAENSFHLRDKASLFYFQELYLNFDFSKLKHLEHGHKIRLSNGHELDQHQLVYELIQSIYLNSKALTEHANFYNLEKAEEVSQIFARIIKHLDDANHLDFSKMTSARVEEYDHENPSHMNSRLLHFLLESLYRLSMFDCTPESRKVQLGIFMTKENREFYYGKLHTEWQFAKLFSSRLAAQNKQIKSRISFHLISPKKANSLETMWRIFASQDESSECKTNSAAAQKAIRLLLCWTRNESIDKEVWKKLAPISEGLAKFKRAFPAIDDSELNEIVLNTAIMKTKRGSVYSSERIFEQLETLANKSSQNLNDLVDNYEAFVYLFNMAELDMIRWDLIASDFNLGYIMTYFLQLYFNNLNCLDDFKEGCSRTKLINGLFDGRDLSEGLKLSYILAILIRLVSFIIEYNYYNMGSTEEAWSKWNSAILSKFKTDFFEAHGVEILCEFLKHEKFISASFKLLENVDLVSTTLQAIVVVFKHACGLPEQSSQVWVSRLRLKEVLSRIKSKSGHSYLIQSSILNERPSTISGSRALKTHNLHLALSHFGNLLENRVDAPSSAKTSRSPKPKSDPYLVSNLNKHQLYEYVACVHDYFLKPGTRRESIQPALCLNRFGEIFAAYVNHLASILERADEFNDRSSFQDSLKVECADDLFKLSLPRVLKLVHLITEIERKNCNNSFKIWFSSDFANHMGIDSLLQMLRNFDLIHKHFREASVDSEFSYHVVDKSNNHESILETLIDTLLNLSRYESIEKRNWSASENGEKVLKNFLSELEDSEFASQLPANKLSSIKLKTNEILLNINQTTDLANIFQYLTRKVKKNEKNVVESRTSFKVMVYIANMSLNALVRWDLLLQLFNLGKFFAKFLLAMTKHLDDLAYDQPSVKVYELFSLLTETSEKKLTHLDRIASILKSTIFILRSIVRYDFKNAMPKLKAYKWKHSQLRGFKAQFVRNGGCQILLKILENKTFQKSLRMASFSDTYLNLKTGETIRVDLAVEITDLIRSIYLNLDDAKAGFKYFYANAATIEKKALQVLLDLAVKLESDETRTLQNMILIESINELCKSVREKLNVSSLLKTMSLTASSAEQLNLYIDRTELVPETPGGGVNVEWFKSVLRLVRLEQVKWRTFSDFEFGRTLANTLSFFSKQDLNLSDAVDSKTTLLDFVSLLVQCIFHFTDFSTQSDDLRVKEYQVEFGYSFFTNNGLESLFCLMDPNRSYLSSLFSKQVGRLVLRDTALVIRNLSRNKKISSSKWRELDATFRLSSFLQSYLSEICHYSNRAASFMEELLNETRFNIEYDDSANIFEHLLKLSERVQENSSILDDLSAEEKMQTYRNLLYIYKQARGNQIDQHLLDNIEHDKCPFGALFGVLVADSIVNLGDESVSKKTAVRTEYPNPKPSDDEFNLSILYYSSFIIEYFTDLKSPRINTKFQRDFANAFSEMNGVATLLSLVSIKDVEHFAEKSEEVFEIHAKALSILCSLSAFPSVKSSVWSDLDAKDRLTSCLQVYEMNESTKASNIVDMIKSTLFNLSQSSLEDTLDKIRNVKEYEKSFEDAEVYEQLLYLAKLLDADLVEYSQFEQEYNWGKQLAHFLKELARNHESNIDYTQRLVPNFKYPAESDKKEKKLAVLVYLLFINQKLLENSTKFQNDFHNKGGLEILCRFLSDDQVLANMDENNRTVLMGILSSLNIMSQRVEDFLHRWKKIDLAERLVQVIDSSQTNDLVNAAQIILMNVSRDEPSSRPALDLSTRAVIDQLKEFANFFRTGKYIEKVSKKFIIDNQFEEAEISCFVKGTMNVCVLTDLLICLRTQIYDEKLSYDQIRDFELAQTLSDIYLNSTSSVEQHYLLDLVSQLCHEPQFVKELLKEGRLVEKLAQNDLGNETKANKRIIETIKRLLKDDAAENSTQLESTNLRQHIVLSFEESQRDLCLKIKEKLENLDLKVWLKIEDYKLKTGDEVGEAVKSCFCFVFCYNEKYVRNSNVKWEFKIAKLTGKHMVPIYTHTNSRLLPISGWMSKHLRDEEAEQIHQRHVEFFRDNDNYDFDRSMILLEKVIVDLYKNLVDSKDLPPLRSSYPVKLEPISRPEIIKQPLMVRPENWSRDQVVSWIHETRLNSQFEAYVHDGQSLKQLYDLGKDNKEFLYQAFVNNQLGENMRIKNEDYEKFCKALNSLFQSHNESSVVTSTVKTDGLTIV